MKQIKPLISLLLTIMLIISPPNIVQAEILEPTYKIATTSDSSEKTNGVIKVSWSAPLSQYISTGNKRMYYVYSNGVSQQANISAANEIEIQEGSALTFYMNCHSSVHWSYIITCYNASTVGYAGNSSSNLLSTTIKPAKSGTLAPFIDTVATKSNGSGGWTTYDWELRYSTFDYVP